MIRKTILVALLASSAATAAAQVPASVPPPAQTAPAPPAPAPAPEPARLAAAERLVGAMWSDELFVSAIAAGIAEHLADPSSAAPNPRDPHHAERHRLTNEATVAEYTRLVRTFAPELRTLAARFYARRLSVAELDESARFYASPAGRRFIQGSIELGRHADALRDYRPEPSPELIAAGVRLASRVESETRHLAPPPPPPPAAQRERRRPPARSGRRPRVEAEADVEVAMPDTVPGPPAPPPPPPAPPADPARLAAAERAVEAMWPDEAFAQPLALEALAETIMALPVSSFGPIPIPGGAGPNASIGQTIEANEPRFQERIRIIARIATEELPRIGPLAAPLYRGALSQLYARTFTVAELDDVTRFYQTPGGRALARETFTGIADPEFVRGLILMTPRLFTEGMGAMVRIGQATSHLPAAPPPPPVASADDHDH
jgi:hypothetical protein